MAQNIIRNQKTMKKKIRTAMEKKKLWVPLENKTDFQIYRSLVEKHTGQNRKKLKGIEKRGKYTYHVDHKYSVKDGFENGILPQIIGSIVNLEMLPWAQNISKNCNSSITLEELLEAYNNHHPPQELRVTT